MCMLHIHTNINIQVLAFPVLSVHSKNNLLTSQVKLLTSVKVTLVHTLSYVLFESSASARSRIKSAVRFKLEEHFHLLG